MHCTFFGQMISNLEEKDLRNNPFTITSKMGKIAGSECYKNGNVIYNETVFAYDPHLPVLTDHIWWAQGSIWGVREKNLG